MSSHTAAERGTGVAQERPGGRAHWKAGSKGAEEGQAEATGVGSSAKELVPRRGRAAVWDQGSRGHRGSPGDPQRVAAAAALRAQQRKDSVLEDRDSAARWRGRAPARQRAAHSLRAQGTGCAVACEGGAL